jgi:SAM-dependent methyltransferase
MERLAGGVEYLDRPVPATDRAASLADIDRLNAWFGGYALTFRAVEGLLGRRGEPSTDPGDRGSVPLVVDVGGGRGDLARRLVRWARRRGRRLRVIVIDRAPADPGPDVLRVCADATALPIRPGAADVVVTSLTLHHLEPAAAVRCLAEMRAAARRGIVVNDLLRSRLTLGLVWLATRLFCRHRFSRADGPLSVRRAYSPRELAALARRAGVGGLRIRRYPCLGRVLAVAA